MDRGTQKEGLTCDRCGATGLQWGMKMRRFVLMDGESIHRCGKSKSKYNNVRTRVEHLDRSFPSGWEAERAGELSMLEKSGVIEGLRFQPQTYLSDAKVGYKVDFFYRQNGIDIYEEVKGKETEEYRIKRLLWHRYGPAQLRVTKKRRGRFYVYETIMPAHKEQFIHVIPVGDREMHCAQSACWCKPTVDPKESHLITHNAADGRVRKEKADGRQHGDGWILIGEIR